MEILIRIKRSMSKEVLLDRSKVRLCLANKNKDIAILNLKNIHYLPSNPSNLVNFALLNDCRIYYNNEKKKLYKRSLKKILASAKR